MVTAHHIGQAGDHLQLPATADGVFAVDRQAGTITPLQAGSGFATAQIPQTTTGATSPVPASSTSSSDIVVVNDNVVTEVDTATGTAASVTEPGADAATQAVIANDQIYLLNGASKQLDVLGLSPLATLGHLPVPPGSDQLLTHDNLVFVNAARSPAAEIVTAAGQATPITKYAPPTTNPPATIAPTTLPAAPTVTSLAEPSTAGVGLTATWTPRSAQVKPPGRYSGHRRPAP